MRLEPSETLDKSPGALLPLLEDYCVLVLEGKDEKGILQRLEELHGDSPFGGHIMRLINHEYASLYHRDPPEAII